MIYEKRVQETWSFEHLPLVQRIFNSEINSSTGVSPAEMLFGNMIDLNRRILKKPINETVSTMDHERPLSSHMSKMLETQDILIRAAAATQLAKDEYHMATHAVEQPSSFPIGSYVLVTHPKGRRSKFQTFKEGPFQVINVIGSKYVLCDMIKGKNFTLHVSNLSPFDYDPERTTPLEVLNHDHMEFVVEKILGHRGDNAVAADMEFNVRWAGYSASDDTWEPISALRDNAIFHTYCIDNRMRRFVPSEHNPKSKYFRPDP